MRLLATVRKSYTMDAERQIHDAMWGKPVLAVVATAPVAEESGIEDFDFFDEILTGNLYGVDLNAESVEITRLSLWLKTARNKHRLQNLEATIKVGDSLIEDADFSDRPFSWGAAFPDVFANGGFDIVIGNPPYVRSADVTGALAFEPRVALDGGVDGLDAYRVLFAAAPAHLTAGGALLIEHGAEQRAELVALAAASGWRVAAAHDDLAGRPRVLELKRGEP